MHAWPTSIRCPAAGGIILGCVTARQPVRPRPPAPRTGHGSGWPDRPTARSQLGRVVGGCVRRRQAPLARSVRRRPGVCQMRYPPVPDAI